MVVGATARDRKQVKVKSTSTSRWLLHCFEFARIMWQEHIVSKEQSTPVRRHNGSLKSSGSQVSAENVPHSAMPMPHVSVPAGCIMAPRREKLRGLLPNQPIEKVTQKPKLAATADECKTQSQQGTYSLDDLPKTQTYNPTAGRLARHRGPPMIFEFQRFVLKYDYQQRVNLICSG